jgi:hypothetical protein
VPIFLTVQEALTLGADKLAVDGVILIGEHGDYLVKDKAQTLYPRFEMFPNHGCLPLRVLQCVALAGLDWVVLRINSSLSLPEMAGFRPGWGAPFTKPAKSNCRNRFR